MTLSCPREGIDIKDQLEGIFPPLARNGKVMVVVKQTIKHTAPR